MIARNFLLKIRFRLAVAGASIIKKQNANSYFTGMGFKKKNR